MILDHNIMIWVRSLQKISLVTKIINHETAISSRKIPVLFIDKPMPYRIQGDKFGQ